MIERVLGRTGLRVSEIGFGAWGIGGNRHGNSYGPTDDAESMRAVHRALDLGCSFFDTADYYGFGHSEAVLGRALEGMRDEVVIATKVGGNFYGAAPRLDMSPGYVRIACEQSLYRLRTDYIDVYQLHNPPAQTCGQPELYEVLADLKREGKIRAAGISIHDPEEGIDAIGTGAPDVVQVVYNVLRREARDRLFPLAEERGVGIIAREPLMNGMLAGRYTPEATFSPGDIRHQWPRAYLERILDAVETFRHEAAERHPGVSLTQVALRFVLADPRVSSVIPGMKTVAQVEENLTASLPDLARA